MRAVDPPAAASAAPPAVELIRPVGQRSDFGADLRDPSGADAGARPAPPWAASRPVEPAPSVPGAPLAVIGFAGQSANLTEATRAELDQLAKRIAEQRVRQIEVRGFAIGSGMDSRKVALARALVVRAYLMELPRQGAHRGRQLCRRRQPR